MLSVRSRVFRLFSTSVRVMNSEKDYGSGSAKGTGGGGTVREAGGSFAKREAAIEEEYFHRKSLEQLKLLKDSVKEEISNHMEEIKRHEELIKRHKNKLKKLSDDGSDSD